jgi:hypothetical protein
LGGIRTPSSSDVTRARSSLVPLLPATITGPELPPFMASARESSRNPPFVPFAP